MGRLLRYVAEPTLDRFHASDAFVRGVMGPVGSGKSVGMCWEIFQRALAQAPSPVDGIRRTRWAIVRNTYGELRDTTFRTWEQWFGDGNFGTFDKTEFIFRFRYNDVEADLLFRALDRPDDVKKLLSLEITGAWINEAREVPKAVLDGLTSRVGRYPALQDGGCTWRGVMMDTNPPDDDHWWFKLAEEDTPKGWEFFRQPGGVHKSGDVWQANPLAENIAHLDGGYDYYLRQLAGKTDAWISTYLGGDYGVISSGKPVYNEYNDSLHASPEPLRPIFGQPLILGWDFGLTPAAVLIQQTPRGGINILREWCAEDMGITGFGENVVLPGLAEFDEFDIISVGDPAGVQRAPTDERSCFEALKGMGIPTRAAKTNAIGARREAVAVPLSKLIDGKPCVQIDPSCHMLRKGFLGRYVYERVQVVGDERYRDMPAKNRYSHPHDACQYAFLELQSQEIKSSRGNRERRPSRSPRSSALAGGY